MVLKFVATATAFGSGVVGGVFTPTLFIGAALGVLYGQAVLYLAPGLRADPAMYGLVGMGSFMAATTGAPLMAILMAFELTLDYSIAPFLMVNCVVAYYCSGIFEKRFMYGESLERKGAAFFKQQLAEVNLQDLVRNDPSPYQRMPPSPKSPRLLSSIGINTFTSSIRKTDCWAPSRFTTSKPSSIVPNSKR